MAPRDATWWLGRASAVVVVTAMLAGCADVPTQDASLPVPPVNVTVAPLPYPPLLPRLPVTAGVFYSSEWRNAEPNGWGSGDPRIRFQLGAAATALFDEIATALFGSVSQLPAWPDPASGSQSVDLVLVPRLDQSLDTFVRFTLAVDVFSRDGNFDFTQEFTSMESPVTAAKPVGTQLACLEIGLGRKTVRYETLADPR